MLRCWDVLDNIYDFWLVKKWNFQVSSPNRRDLDWQLSKWFPFHGFYESSRPALFSNDGSHSRQKARVPHEHGGEKKHAVLFWWVCSHIMVSVIWPEACLDDRYCLHGYILLWWLAAESIMQDLSTASYWSWACCWSSIWSTIFRPGK